MTVYRPPTSPEPGGRFEELLAASAGTPRVWRGGDGPVDLRAGVERLAAQLAAWRAPDRSRVAVLSDPARPLDAVTAYLGVLAGGHTPGLLRPAAEMPNEYLAGRGFRAVLAGGDLQVITGGAEPDDTEDLVVFTSGSTARPKGVRYSWAGVSHNLAATQSYLQLSGDDRVALPLPVHYIYGLSTLNLALRVGAALNLVDYQQPPVRWLASLLSWQPTVLSVVPHQAKLLSRVDAFNADRLPKLRCLTVAGGPLPAEFTCRLLARFPGAEIFLMYGQTEAGPRISYLPPDSLPEHAGSIGAGIAGFTQLRLADPTEDVAEMQVASASVMLGYLDPGDPSPVGDDGWLSTGDLAYRDPSSGFYFVVGRCAPFFKPFDERVSFREVLDAARAVLPDATFRLQLETDPLLGEQLLLTAATTTAPGEGDARRVRQALRRLLGSARAPRVVLIQRDEATKLA